MNGPAKESLRRELRKKRAALANREEKDLAIFRAVSALPLYREARRILFYVSTPEEADTRRLLRAALEEGKEIYAPLCKEGAMSFYRIGGMEDLRPGSFGILEPDPARRPRLERGTGWEDAVCLVPGLAFDRRGYRLGYGKGYYDRFLAGENITSIGLCYGELVVPKLPAEGHDRQVRLLATEEGVTACPSLAGNQERKVPES